MTIAYLVNLYPRVSHSFIRREIIALENIGLSVARFSIHSGEFEVVDPADKLELEKTRVVLKAGITRLFFCLIFIAITRPIRWFKALFLALKIGWRSDRGVWRHLAYLVEACVLSSWFSDLKVTHIHAHFAANNSAAVAMLCSALEEIPYSFTVHGPAEFDRATGLALNEKVKRAAFVAAISSFCRSQLYRACEYKYWTKIYLIRCGIDECYLNKPLLKIPDAPNFVSVARLDNDKGQLLLIEVASRLAAEGLNFNIVLVGDGPFRSKLETLISARGLEDYINITGWATADEVQHEIANSRVLVLPSFAEGLPIVIMEALALGRPVISTYIAGIPELVENGNNGWLVPAGSVEALTEAMRSAIKFPSVKLEQMGEHGRKQVVEKHNAANEAKKLAFLFQSTSRDNLKSKDFASKFEDYSNRIYNVNEVQQQNH